MASAKRSVPNYLPGCYCNLPCERGESLPGYLLRLAEANGYGGIREFLRIADVSPHKSLRAQLLQLRTDAHTLARIGRIAVGDARHLDPFLAEALPADPGLGPPEALFFEERRVDVDALYPARSPVCPACLADGGIAREEWDLAPVTVCAVHGTVLIDACPTCGAALEWSRPQLLYCGQCGADLRGAPAVPASPAAQEVSMHFQVLAPFRVKIHGGRRLVVDWDEMFRAFKALLLPDWAWALASYPRSLVADSAVAARHALIEQLAGTLSGAQYDPTALRGKARQALAPLTALPNPQALEEAALEFLAVVVGLSRELAAALCCEHEPQEPPRAAELYAGRPPSLQSPEDLQAFLGATADEVSRLLELGVIVPRTREQVGYDADHLLRARAFLDALLSTDALSAIVGVEVRESDLEPAGLLPRWNRHARYDARVMPQELLGLQRQLAACWHRREPIDHGLSLRELVQATDTPFALVSAAVKAIVGGTIQRFGWEAPYRWCDLVLTPEDAEQLGLRSTRVNPGE